MNILESLKNLILLFPILIYYFIEALFLGIFVSFTWRIFLSELFNVYITYFQWVGIIWIIKILMFDVFKILASINNITAFLKNNEENNNQN